MLDLKDNNGYSALHLAALVKNNKNINLLIKYGASINILTDKGDTFLDIYCYESNNNIKPSKILIEKLFYSGASVTIFTMVYLYKMKIVNLY